MPRQPRRVLPGTPHHVVLRGNNRRKIFSYAYERSRFLSLVHKAEPACAIHALCLMSNHIHLIATPKKREDLGRFVKYFAQCYAQLRNRRLRSSGKLFEARYWSRPIENEAYLAVATAYVDDNARTANLERNEDYPWSTLGLHSGTNGSHPRVEDLWTASCWYRSLGASDLERQAEYRGWLDRYRDHKAWKEVTRGVPERQTIVNARRPNDSRAA